MQFISKKFLIFYFMLFRYVSFRFVDLKRNQIFVIDLAKYVIDSAKGCDGKSITICSTNLA